MSCLMLNSESRAGPLRFRCISSTTLKVTRCAVCQAHECEVCSETGVVSFARAATQLSLLVVASTALTRIVPRGTERAVSTRVAPAPKHNTVTVTRTRLAGMAHAAGAPLTSSETRISDEPDLSCPDTRRAPLLPAPSGSQPPASPSLTPEGC